MSIAFETTRTSSLGRQAKESSGSSISRLPARVSTSTTPPSPTVRTSRLRRPKPIPNSYWATPYLVACEFPFCPQTPEQVQKHTKQKLDALLLAGVRTFIDLTEPHELFPYSPHLTERCALVGIDPREVEYHNFPIRDRSLPDSVDFVRRIMAVLRDNESRGRIAAVHCRGGIGRTGLIVGCWLVDCGIAKDGDDALRMIAEEWKTVEKCKRYPLSPETGPQHEYVRTFERAAWIDEKHEVL
ncbi:protein-tyrosine phosphatase-like protein [Dichomitus squalens]|uniref:Protein-tyrosine phosphatase-like protein n=2 Tax=Dichomitus squalens TaxID=114155 RepID=A0A4Q9NAT5_9APHY|nr:protein-tyrosine phosphatase-like protein [Dichomitus squalens]TBU51237.1 protein-tyrosine phosphatase-like protein [Dichomitus squalens]